LPKIEFAICIDEIEAGMVMADPVNVPNEMGLTVFRIRSGAPINEKIIEKLMSLNVKELKVSMDSEDVARYVALGKIDASKFGTPKNKETRKIEPPPIKSLIGDEMKHEAISNIRNLFTSFGEGDNMTRAYQAVIELDKVVDQLVNTIKEESNSFVHVSGIKSYDEYTYHHSLSVAILAIAIGQEKGLDVDRLRKLGQSAILHDIGKTMVPLEIINKKGPLTDEEFAIVKEHSNKGGIYLQQCGVRDPELLAAVIHHHEKVDGTGYPDKLKDDAIPLFSQIISVADVYDAVTSFRPYRSPMSPAQAIELIISESGRSFEPSIIKAFIRKIEPYPLNTVVELSDKRVGMVVANTKTLRPMLCMLDDGKNIDLMDFEHLHLVIAKVLDSFDG